MESDESNNARPTTSPVTVGAATIRASLSSLNAGERRSHDSDGPFADGSYLVFDSDATNLVPGDTNGMADVFVRDLAAGTTERVSVATNGAQATARALWAGYRPTGDSWSSGGLSPISFSVTRTVPWMSFSGIVG